MKSVQFGKMADGKIPSKAIRRYQECLGTAALEDLFSFPLLPFSAFPAVWMKSDSEEITTESHLNTSNVRLDDESKHTA